MVHHRCYFKMATQPVYEVCAIYNMCNISAVITLTLYVASEWAYWKGRCPQHVASKHESWFLSHEGTASTWLTKRDPVLHFIQVWHVSGGSKFQCVLTKLPINAIFLNFTDCSASLNFIHCAKFIFLGSLQTPQQSTDCRACRLTAVPAMIL